MIYEKYDNISSMVSGVSSNSVNFDPLLLTAKQKGSLYLSDGTGRKISIKEGFFTGENPILVPVKDTETGIGAK